MCSDGLANAMHGQRWNPNVYGTDSCLGCDDRSDCTAARAIVPHDELLDVDSALTGEFPNHEPRLRIRSIALIAIGLDDGTLVQQRRMTGVMLPCPIGMYGMC